MKKIVFILTLVFLTSHLFSQVQTTPGSAEYLSEFTESINNLKGSTWQYLKALTKGKNARVVESKRQKLLSEIKDVKSEISRKRGFQSDNTFKDAVVDYIDLSYTVLKEDYDKILDMEDIAEQSYDAMEAYMLARELANAKLDSAFMIAQNAQDVFAAEHNINILDAEEDKTSEKIRKASDAIHYYNEIYLTFFKSYKQEAYVLDALNRADVVAAEQNNNSFQIFANEGLESLKNINSYRGDATLKVALREMLDFYADESEKDFTGMIDFYVKKDNFEKLQKMMESKSKRDRTQEDVDKYNNAVKEYNEAISTFNATNDAANKKRAEKLEKWNEKVLSFFETHTN